MIGTITWSGLKYPFLKWSNVKEEVLWEGIVNIIRPEAIDQDEAIAEKGQMKAGSNAKSLETNRDSRGGLR